MAELKTKQTEASVDDYLNAIQDEATRHDCLKIAKMMQQVTKAKPKMWGTSIVGFGKQHLKYASGRELDWMIMGFSSRKQNITLYLSGTLETYHPILKKLGKHTTGKGCLYIKKLADVDQTILKDLVTASLKSIKQPNS